MSAAPRAALRSVGYSMCVLHLYRNSYNELSFLQENISLSLSNWIINPD